MKLISAVIVTWNSQQVIGDCVSTLLAHVPHEDIEIILVDNGSQDSTYLEDYQNNPNVIVIRNGENLGFSKAVNIGLRHATGDYFLILNPDLVFQYNPFPNLLKELLKNPEIGVIGPLLYGSDGQPQIKHYYPSFPSIPQYVIFRSILAIVPPLPKLALRYFHARVGRSGLYFVDQIPGAFFLFHRNLFGTSAALNEAYFIWMEDVDFCLRVHRMGLKVAVAADEKVTHIGGTSFNAWDDSRKRLMFTRSYLTYLKLNAHPVSYWIHTALMGLNSASFFLLTPRYFFRYGIKGMKARLDLEAKTLSMILNHMKSQVGLKP